MSENRALGITVDLRGRVALVTGAAGGIGRSTARALSQNGAVVAIIDVVNAQQTCDEIQELGGRASFFQADVSNSTQVNDAIERIERELGPVAILVNNAGVNTVKNRVPIYQFEDAEWDRIIRTNLDGTFYCSRAASARMVERKAGVIINISSVFGVVPARLQCAYTAAKAGIINFTKSHALETGSYGIRVNAIAPGSILTNGTRSLFYNRENKTMAEGLLSHIPLGRPGETDDIAAAALFLASDAAKYITGHVLVVDGGWTAGFSRDW